jgi:ankyrin repeat protein
VISEFFNSIKKNCKKKSKRYVIYDWTQQVNKKIDKFFMVRNDHINSTMNLLLSPFSYLMEWKSNYVDYEKIMKVIKNQYIKQTLRDYYCDKLNSSSNLVYPDICGDEFEEIFSEMLKNDILDVTKLDSNGTPVLNNAVFNKDLKIARLIMEKIIKNIEARDNISLYLQGETLMCAVSIGKLEDVEKILNNNCPSKVPVNYLDKNQNTPLHSAVYYRKYNIAKFLLEKNANINIQNKYGETPLHMIPKLQLDNDNNGLYILHLLINKNIIDHQDNNGNTALMIAINESFCNKKFICHLVKNYGKKINMNAQNLNYDTALTIAAKYNYNDIVELLLKFNADPNMKNKNGETMFSSLKKNG